MDDSWEQTHFGSTTNATANTDSDQDGMLDWQEYISGTEPTNNHSWFKIKSSQLAGNENVLQWEAVTGRYYNLYWSTSLDASFQILNSNLSYNSASTVSFTDQVHDAENQIFYQINVRQ